jgi:MSHA biogenesis protein MshK
MIKYGCLFFLCWFHPHLWAESLVDPTRPQNKGKQMLVEEQNKELLLSAIFITANAKQAVINGQSYSEGQRVLAYTVASIRQNVVELNGPQGKQSLFINNDNIKKDADDGF